MFIHNSRSGNGRKTTASVPAVCRRISVATLTFIAGFPQTDFDTKLANFFLKLVLPDIVKELQSNFLISTLCKLDNYFIYRKSSIKPPGGLIFSSTFEGGLNREGGGGLKEMGGLFNLAKRITCSKNTVV